MQPSTTWDRETSEETFAAYIDAARQSVDQSGTAEALVEFLPERNRLYRGRGTNATVRMRGYLLAVFEDIGLPEVAVPFVLEELESGRDAYLVAAAAKALRGYAEPSGRFLPFLFKAIFNIRDKDDAITFASYKPTWPARHRTTALREIFETFAWLGVHALPDVERLDHLLLELADVPVLTREGLTRAIATIRSASDRPPCCQSASLMVNHPAAVAVAEPNHGRTIPAGIDLEDQDTNVVASDLFFRRMPTVVVFFYTRCDNPNKCSLTITKLAQLQRAFERTGLADHVQTAAVTYDPAYDLAPRLRGYGENRGVIFDDRNRFFRAVARFDRLQEFFTLGVNYGPALVNRHRIELFLVDGNGRLVDEFTRLQWDVEEVLAAATALIQPAVSQTPVHRSRIVRALAMFGAKVAEESSGCCGGTSVIQMERPSSH